jgi:hypothetical protein
MKTLEEHNDSMLVTRVCLNYNEPRRNGIECPECKAELFDTRPWETLASMPPQHSVHCGECGYHGYRY